MIIELFSIGTLYGIGSNGIRSLLQVRQRMPTLGRSAHSPPLLDTAVLLPNAIPSLFGIILCKLFLDKHVVSAQSLLRLKHLHARQIGLLRAAC